MFRTLIVEDNKIFRQSLKEMVGGRFAFMLIDEAGDGKEAREKVHTLCPDLIFMDIKLRGESGLELTKAIKTRHKKTIIIMLTNYDLPEYRRAAYGCGASYFIAKGSSTIDEVVGIVESVLSDLGFGSKGRKVTERA